METKKIKRIEIPNYDETVLICQGGGALGSYQAGVFEGLHQNGFTPTWVAGISIGSLNSCIIAGNAPEKRVEKLQEFWNRICRPSNNITDYTQKMANIARFYAPDLATKYEQISKTLFGGVAAWEAIMFGQQSFFTPKLFAPGFGNPKDIGFYDTAPMIRTLEQLADFDRINHSGEMRVSLGATNVRTGNFAYFDNQYMILKPEHFVASGSLPEGFPATEIDGEFYWDGGCVSNTPLSYIISEGMKKNMLVFQVDLWSAEGTLPKTIFEVEERKKDIQYSSRTRSITQAMRTLHEMREIIFDIVEQIPEEVKKQNKYFEEIAKSVKGGKTNVIHLIYKKDQSEGYYKDIEFSKETKERHWKSGLIDVDETLKDIDCIKMPKQGENFVTYDVHRKTRYTAMDSEPLFKKAILDKYKRN